MRSEPLLFLIVAQHGEESRKSCEILQMDFTCFEAYYHRVRNLKNFYIRFHVIFRKYSLQFHMNSTVLCQQPFGKSYEQLEVGESQSRFEVGQNHQISFLPITCVQPPFYVTSDCRVTIFQPTKRKDNSSASSPRLKVEINGTFPKIVSNWTIVHGFIFSL